MLYVAVQTPGMKTTDQQTCDDPQISKIMFKTNISSICGIANKLPKVADINNLQLRGGGGLVWLKGVNIFLFFWWMSFFCLGSTITTLCPVSAVARISELQRCKGDV